MVFRPFRDEVIEAKVVGSNKVRSSTMSLDLTRSLAGQRGGGGIVGVWEAKNALVIKQAPYFSYLSHSWNAKKSGDCLFFVLSIDRCRIFLDNHSTSNLRTRTILLFELSVQHQKSGECRIDVWMWRGRDPTVGCANRLEKNIKYGLGHRNRISDYWFVYFRMTAWQWRFDCERVGCANDRDRIHWKPVEGNGRSVCVCRYLLVCAVEGLWQSIDIDDFVL